MSSAVHSLQVAIVDGKQSLTQLLRQTKLIAAKLGVKDVECWVDYELKGYPNGVQVPEYREFVTERVEVMHPSKGWQFAGHINIKLPALHPISELESLSKSETLGFLLKEEDNFTVQDNLNTGWASKWPQRVTFAPSQFQRIIEGVTNELLQWTIELEKRGIKGEDMTFDEKEKQSAATAVFHNTFLGINSRMNYSSTDASINVVDSGSLFSTLQTEIERHVADDDLKQRLLQKATELKASAGKETFAKTFSEFIGLAANHLSSFAPLVQELTKLIKV